MQFKISDLLDDFQDHSLDISFHVSASETRIKRLTMDKLRKKCQPVSKSRSSGRLIVKAILLAAVIICSSITVLAALSDHIFQWIKKPEEAVGYDNDIYIGSVSYNWDLYGWVCELKAEASNSTGLTIACKEWGTQEKSGTLSTDDAYWIEKWDGIGYSDYLPEQAPIAVDSSILIQQNTTVSWSINWVEHYGVLKPGIYRLGKIFSHTSETGNIRELPVYVKFRVFDETMESYYIKYKSALNALVEQKHLHMTLQVFPEDPNGYTSYTQDIWRCDENYWETLSYLNDNRELINRSGSALLDGKGYRLISVNDYTQSDDMQYHLDQSVEESLFTYWYTFLTLSDVRISEMSIAGNKIIFSECRNDESDTNFQTVLTLNNDGHIQNIDQYQINAGAKKLYITLTVHDTDTEQITQFMDLISHSCAINES